MMSTKKNADSMTDS